MLTRMKELGRPFHYVVTATTRPRRANEKDGVNYHFVSGKEFQKMIDENGLLEWANVYGNYYGVPRNEIATALSKGLDTIVKVDVQGATSIKKTLPQAVLVFLMPPSMEALEERLRKRRSESCAELALRLERARDEVDSLPLFDYVITSHQNEIDEIVSQMDAIVAAEKRRVKSRIAKL